MDSSFKPENENEFNTDIMSLDVDMLLLVSYDFMELALPQMPITMIEERSVYI